MRHLKEYSTLHFFFQEVKSASKLTKRKQLLI